MCSTYRKYSAYKDNTKILDIFDFQQTYFCVDSCSIYYNNLEIERNSWDDSRYVDFISEPWS